MFPLCAYTDPSAASGAPRSTLRIQDGNSSSARTTELSKWAVLPAELPFFVWTPANRSTSSTAHTSHLSSSSRSSFAHSSASLHATATLRRHSSFVSVYAAQSLLPFPGESDDAEPEAPPLSHTLRSTSFARLSGATSANTAPMPDSLRYGSDPSTDKGRAKAVW